MENIRLNIDSLRLNNEPPQSREDYYLQFTFCIVLSY